MRSYRGRLLLTTIGVAVLGQLSTIPSAGQADARFGELVEVELVDVDVWVADRQGRPVSGLESSDFEIFHDGRPVEIRHFVEIRDGQQVRGERDVDQAAPPPKTASRVPAHVVIYFDQSRLHPTHYPPLIRGLGEFLAAEQVAPQEVLIVRQERGLFVEAPFGSTRGELEAALGRLAKGKASGAALEAETEQAMDAIRRSWEENQDAAGSAASAIAGIPATTPGGSPTGSPVGGPRATVGGVGTGGGSDACGSFLGQIQPVLSSWARSRGERAAVTLSNLSDLVGFLSGLPGVKTLLYLSDGLDTNPGAALASYAAGFCPEGSTQLLSGARFEEMTPRFLELTRHANSNRVTVHALQASGLSASPSGSAAAGRRGRGRQAQSGGSFEQSRRSQSRRGLEVLAGETGGRTIVNQNEFGGELERIATEAGTYYSLAYEPPDGGEGREHRIEVRLKDDSLEPRYRRAYLQKNRDRRLTERIEGALNLGIVDNPLGLRLGAGASEPLADDRHRILLHVNVPVDRIALMPQDDGVNAELLVRVLARSVESGALSIRDKTFRLKVPSGASGFADLPVDLELPEGMAVIAIGLQHLGSGEASYVSTTLEIGAGS